MNIQLILWVYPSHVLILLPPSEKKNPRTEATGVVYERLSFASELTQTRTSLISKIDANLLSASTSPAIEIYAGVLYKTLDFRSLPVDSQRRANDRILIFSTLFGVLRPTDQIPAYRAKMKISDWKKPLSFALDNIENQLIIDCRSSTYSAAWKPDSTKTVTVGVFQEINGIRSVITHMSKKYRGQLTQLLVENKDLDHPQELLAFASQSFKAELHPPTKTSSWHLDLIIKN